MRRTADEALINSSIRFGERLNLVYLNNPKVACSTIKASMWTTIDKIAGRETYKDNPHALVGAPFVPDMFAREAYGSAAVAKATWFSVVRNPFVRILSAYLEKVGNDPAVWRPFASRFGIRREVTTNELSFRDFLIIIRAEPDELLDPHFRPQYLNVLWHICQHTLIGRIEAFAETAKFLAEHGTIMKDVRIHATNARERLSTYYNEETVALVAEKYADDFRIFGYSTRVEESGDTASDRPLIGDSHSLINWIIEDAYPVHDFDQQTMAFHQYELAKTRDEKLGIVDRDYETQDNWQRLQKYIAFAVSAGEYALARKALERVAAMTSLHYAAVGNPAIFSQNRK